MTTMLPLLTAAFLWASTPPPKHHHTVVTQQRSFEANGYSCVAQILETHTPSDERNEEVTITCDGAPILTHDLEDAGIGNVALNNVDSMHVRLIVPWERGTAAGLTVIEAHHERTGAKAEVVFEHSSACGAETFDNGDVIFTNVGKRLLGDEILPAGTNVYRWKDGKYMFDQGFRWRPTATDNDRYCILMNPASCPAEIASKPVPDSEDWATPTDHK